MLQARRNWTSSLLIPSSKLLGNRHRILFFKQCNSVSAANDWAKTSSNAPVASQPWNAWGLLDSKNKTVVESFIHYGRESACTLAFNSYAAASPSYTETIKSLGTITLPNGQTSMAIGYTTEALPVTGVPHCCGTCSIYFNNLQMLYWPAVHPNTACFGKPSAALNSTSTSAETAAQDQSIYATDSDGYVL